MRRPRAFTCSRLRAEPLPPPPRKPLGYLHEEGWVIARSSSPCKCDTCGRDSPLSTPPPKSQGGGLRTPEARSFSNMHPWRPADGTPPRTESPGASLDSHARGNSVSRASVSRRTPFPAERSAKPARRIVLFNTQQEPLGVNGIGNGNAAGGVYSVGPAERKRASDGAGGDSGGGACGDALPLPWSSYSLASSASAAAAASLRAISTAYSGATAMDTATTAAATATTTLTAAASASAASGGAYDGKQDSNDAAATSAETPVPIFRPLFAASDAIAQGQAPCPAGGAAMAISMVPHNTEDRSDGFVKGLDAWKAPETDGTFSLGAPSQASGVGRRRRTLRFARGG